MSPAAQRMYWKRGAGRGEGVCTPKFVYQKMALINISFCKFFPTMKSGPRGEVQKGGGGLLLCLSAVLLHPCCRPQFTLTEPHEHGRGDMHSNTSYRSHKHKTWASMPQRDPQWATLLPVSWRLECGRSREGRMPFGNEESGWVAVSTNLGENQSSSEHPQCSINASPPRQNFSQWGCCQYGIALRPLLLWCL